MADFRLFVQIGYVTEKMFKWIRLCVQTRKEDVVFVIQPNKAKKVASKYRTARWREEKIQAEEKQDGYSIIVTEW